MMEQQDRALLVLLSVWRTQPSAGDDTRLEFPKYQNIILYKSETTIIIIIIIIMWNVR